MSSAREFYDRYWENPGAAPPALDPLSDKRLQLFLPLVPPGSCVLEVGCGAGLQTRKLAARWKMVALDISPLALAAARQALSNGRWACASVESGLPFADASFQAVYCCEVIEHLLDVRGALREMQRVLAPGGLLFLSTPYHGLVKNVALALFGFERHFDPAGPHIRFFTRRTLLRALDAAGFRMKGFRALGRAWPVWMNMVVWARKV
ncbi:MAG: class I SAM-dependent methyltransferase [Acidobacteria bacterium]|nr:class I SAM-dependent methyltransferase [Acidobacteriota bacterium]